VAVTAIGPLFGSIEECIPRFDGFSCSKGREMVLPNNLALVCLLFCSSMWAWAGCTEPPHPSAGLPSLDDDHHVVELDEACALGRPWAERLGDGHSSTIDPARAQRPRELQLLALLADDESLDEIVSLGTTGWNLDVRRRIEVRGHAAELVVEKHQGHVRRRPLAAEEWAELQRFLRETKFDALPDFDNRVLDGVSAHYTHLTRGCRAQVYMNNPQVEPRSAEHHPAYHTLVDHFRRLTRTGDWTTTIDLGGDVGVVTPLLLSKHIPETVLAVCVDDGRLKVEVEFIVRQTWKRVQEWRTVELHPTPHLGGPAEPCQGWTPFRRQHPPYLRLQRCAQQLSHGASPRTPDGLPTAFAELAVFSPDGRYAVVGRLVDGVGSWDEPNHLVRVDLETCQEAFVDLLPDVDLSVRFFLPDDRRALVERAGRQWLLDIDTMQLLEVDDVPHLFDVQQRSYLVQRRPAEFVLPSTSTPGVYWASLTEGSLFGPTTLGRFEPAALAFVPVATVDAWLTHGMFDVEGDTVFAAIEGDLVSFPLPSGAASTGRARR